MTITFHLSHCQDLEQATSLRNLIKLLLPLYLTVMLLLIARTMDTIHDQTKEAYELSCLTSLPLRYS